MLEFLNIESFYADNFIDSFAPPVATLYILGLPSESITTLALFEKLFLGFTNLLAIIISSAFYWSNSYQTISSFPSADCINRDSRYYSSSNSFISVVVRISPSLVLLKDVPRVLYFTLN